MADFTDRLALGTSRMNPSSMVPGSTGNAPQGGFGTQLKQDLTKSPNAQVASQATGRDLPATREAQKEELMRQLQGGVSAAMQRTRVQLPGDRAQTFQSDLPTETQKMLPGRDADAKPKKRNMRPEDFEMLSNVFKTLAEQ